MSENSSPIPVKHPLIRYKPIRIFFIGGTLTYAVFDLFSTHVGYAGQVTGRSMQPTFNPWLGKSNDQGISRFLTFDRIKALFTPCYDWVWLKPLKYENLKLKPGEIVTLVNPMECTSKDIKRVVATEGQTVITRSYKNAVVVVPKGHIWVEGDNHKLSKDSNAYGPIPIGLVKCRATHIIVPFHRAGRLNQSSLPPRPNPRTRGLPDLIAPNDDC